MNRKGSLALFALEEGEGSCQSSAAIARELPLGWTHMILIFSHKGATMSAPNIGQ
ncbi:hypothetical protein CY34DRAFT_802183 [Suillus luteus UH-Slu-Lm8-n1]|uniref:Uncharacterized protein n=1 Tax=Suillus luteus UH-Slu-Lm8-n1 TaxID=930992 RepID=A0A0D0ATA6_9AGAM|nr:hypothetical protein CY34DRAFT_802183 [Suillus luteus UH-Slu-Lm8-n1]